MGRWAEKFVGLAARGKHPCWLLVRQVWEEQLRFHMPSYEEADAYKAISENEGMFFEVPRGQEKPYDAVLMKGMFPHIGVVVAKGQVLHVPIGEHSRVEDFRDVKIERIMRGPWEARHAL